MLNSVLQFRNANPNTLTDPAKLQQITTNIACAVRVPFENVIINNITLPDGRAIQFNKAVTSLNSNGEVRCYRRTGNRLRYLQSTLDTTINIDFSIVDPVPELLSMSGTEFVSNLQSDPAVNDLVITLESSGVTAIAPQELATSSPTTNAAVAAISPQVIGIIAGTISAFLVATIAIGCLIASRRPKIMKPANQNPVIIFIENPNPLRSTAF